jgi:hypothetical protein
MQKGDCQISTDFIKLCHNQALRILSTAKLSYFAFSFFYESRERPSCTSRLDTIGVHQMPEKNPAWDMESMVKFLQLEEIILFEDC